MGPAFYSLLGGFLVNIMPGAKRKQGLETLNVEQHRPPIAYIISYGILFIAFIAFPIYYDMKYGRFYVEAHILSLIGFGIPGFIFVAHCHNYYHCFTETGIRWRNWRRKVRYFDYYSIYKVTYEQTSKNGWVKIRSTQLPKHIKLGFDTNQFDATILYTQYSIVWRLGFGRRCGRMNDSSKSSPVGRGYGFYRIMLGLNPSKSPVSPTRLSRVKVNLSTASPALTGLLASLATKKALRSSAPMIQHRRSTSVPLCQVPQRATLVQPLSP